MVGFDYLVRWNPNDGCVSGLADCIANIRKEHPYLTVCQLVALVEEPFFAAYKGRALKHFPDIIALDDEWYALFPDGSRRDVECEVKEKERLAAEAGNALKSIVDWSPTSPTCILKNNIETFRQSFPEISVERLVKMVAGPAFYPEFEAVVRREYPDAIAVDHVWYILMPDGESKDVEYELRAEGKL